MQESKILVLKTRITQLLKSPTPGDDLIAMRLCARPSGENPVAQANYKILVALAKHIGTRDPMSEANLKGISEKREEFERILGELLSSASTETPVE